MHCFNLTASYAVLTKLVALRLECVHYRLNWAEKGVGTFHIGIYFFMFFMLSSFLIPKSERYDYFTPQLTLFRKGSVTFISM